MADFCTFFSPPPRRNCADAFRTQVIGAKEIRSPIKVIGEQIYFHTRCANIYLVAVTSQNANAALVFEFLYRTIEVLKSYFHHLDEEGVRNNIFLIYELMDGKSPFLLVCYLRSCEYVELLDFGYPQVTSAEILKMSVVQEGTVAEGAVDPAAQKDFTIQATGAVSHRREGIKYRKNEVFLDVIESVNLLVSQKGNLY